MSLRIARKIAKISQTELAKRSGIDNSTICRIENGLTELRQHPFATVKSLALALGIDADELVWFVEIPDPTRKRRADHAADARPRSKSRATRRRRLSAAIIAPTSERS